MVQALGRRSHTSQPQDQVQMQSRGGETFPLLVWPKALNSEGAWFLRAGRCPVSSKTCGVELRCVPTFLLVTPSCCGVPTLAALWALQSRCPGPELLPPSQETPRDFSPRCLVLDAASPLCRVHFPAMNAGLLCVL